MESSFPLLMDTVFQFLGMSLYVRRPRDDRKMENSQGSARKVGDASRYVPLSLGLFYS